MNKKISLGAAIAFMLIVAAATFSMSMLYAMSTFNEKVYSVKEHRCNRGGLPRRYRGPIRKIL